VTAAAAARNQQSSRQSIRLRARSFIAFALAPELPIIDWLADLDKWLRRSPGFFVGRPLVLDLSATSLSASGIAHLLAELKERGIRIMGIEGAKEAQLEPSLPPLLKGGRGASGEAGESQADQSAQGGTPERQQPTSLLLECAIRSGQSVIFPRGDITVIGSVASGAELVAGGSIHIHGALRGRAMAGTNGDPRARIFCRKNEAELLAIDGCYLTSEEMDPKLRGQPVQAYLEDGSLSMAALD